MPQNKVQITLDHPYIREHVDKALDALEMFTQGMVAMSPEERRRLTKMGDKSEAFCRLAVDVFQQNRGVLPANFDMDGYLMDIEALNALRPRLVRMNKIFQLISDTEMALGSDLMANSLEGYAYLKIAGKSVGLDDLRAQMSARFHRGPRKQTEPVTGQ